MITLRRVKALVLGHDLSADATRIALEASSVPIADVDCRTCPEPCTDGPLILHPLMIGLLIPPQITTHTPRVSTLTAKR